MNNLSTFLDVIIFATIKHKQQKRKGITETPYIVHPLQVAKTLLEIGKINDIDTIKAAILHDTIEDTDTTALEIEKKFGKHTKDIVLELTDNKSLPVKERKGKQISLMASKSIEAQNIKIADKTCNVIDLINDPPKKWNVQRIKDYLDWAKQVVDNSTRGNKLLLNHFNSVLSEAYHKYE